MSMMDKVLFNAMCAGEYAVGYSAKGAGFGIEYTGIGIKKVGEFIETQGKNLRIYGENKIMQTNMGRKFLNGELSEQEMKEYLAQRPELKKALEDKAKAEATQAPKTTATPKGEVDPANGVMKNYQEGDELSPADAAEIYA